MTKTMRKIQNLLLTAAMLIASLAASAQGKMTIELKNGTNLSFFVSEISKITWTDGTDTPSGGENDPGEQTVTGDAKDVTSYSATVTCYANNILDNEATDLKVGVIYTDNGTPSKSNGTQVTVSKSSIGSDGKYSVKLNDLKENTTYQYRSFVYQSGIYFLGQVKSFTTLPQQAAVTFFTGNATNVTCFSAKVSAQMTIESSSVYSKLSYGICYGTTAEPTEQQQVTSKDASGTYSTTLKGLAGGTIYYYRPYANMDGTIHYGPVSSFKTSEDNVVETGEADARGNVKSKLTIGGGAYSQLVLGLCWSTTNEVPTISDNTVTTNEVDDDNCYTLFVPAILTGTHYYRSYVKVDGVAHYGETKVLNLSTFETTAVDLGLSVKWANMNVGADAPGAYGDYFAWGETEAKSTYNWSTYKYMQEGYSDWQHVTKYTTADNQTSGCWYDGDTYVGTTVDGVTYKNKTVLDLEDDAAHVNWGGDWRMPTREEQDELRAKCSWKWTTSGGVKGYVVTGPNGNSIFLPAAGGRDGSSLSYVGSWGHYWSSSLNSGDSRYAYCMGFNLGNVGYANGDRSGGLPVRPVCP